LILLIDVSLVEPMSIMRHSGLTSIL